MSSGWPSRNSFKSHPLRRPAQFVRSGTWARSDAINIDDPQDAQRLAHSILLEAEIPKVENLARMSWLPFEGLRFSAAQMRIVGIGVFPVRAWARVLP
jgi:kynurenine formamidase